MQLQATTGKALADSAGSNKVPPPDLSLAGHWILPVVFFAVALLAIDISRRSSFISTIWPVNAIILVALLRYAPSLRNYGSIFAGGICAIALANVALDVAPGPAAILGVANNAEVAIALALLCALHIGASNLTSFRNLFIFIVIVALVPIVSDVFIAMTIGSAHNIPWPTVWMNSYPGHALGMTIVVPFLISVTSSEWRALYVRRRVDEAVTILLAVVVVTICAAYFRTILFIVVPAILLATVRFGVIGATVATFVVALIFSSFVVMGIGQPILSHAELSQRILALQILMAFTSLWSLPIAALLTERDYLLENLSLANSQLKLESERKSHLVIGLHRHLSTAEEKERLRLSHELHDQAGQSLIASILELSEIDPLVEGAARQRLHMIRKRMEEMGKTLHRIAWELRPPSIDELGLRNALASYIEDWGEQCGTAVDFHCDNQSVNGVPNDIGSAIFRVVQEALTNIVKHAQKPSSVSVVVRRVNATLQVIVEDDGCGFDVGAVAATAGHTRGLGLDGMRERLLLIGGTLEIESTRGAGTTIFARIPLDGQRSAA